MIRFQHLVEDLLTRLRDTRVATFLPAKAPPSAPAPVTPRPPRWPPKPPVRLPPMPPMPPMPPIQPPVPLPMPVPAAAALPASVERYPRHSTTWGLEGGWAPTTSGFETRVFDPPANPPKPQPAVRAFSIFDDLFDGG